jgi:metal-sulfur cluster biosynthetic enzyme
MKKFDITNAESILERQIQELLKTVLDPELHINIIDLGLVYDIAVSEPARLITITMTLSSRYCPMGDAILHSVKNCLEHSYDSYQVEVQLTWEPQWGYDRISEEGLRQLRG